MRGEQRKKKPIPIYISLLLSLSRCLSLSPCCCWLFFLFCFCPAKSFFFIGLFFPFLFHNLKVLHSYLKHIYSCTHTHTHNASIIQKIRIVVVFYFPPSDDEPRTQRAENCHKLTMSLQRWSCLQCHPCLVIHSTKVFSKRLELPLLRNSSGLATVLFKMVLCIG